jgi:hypothetical protein
VIYRSTAEDVTRNACFCFGSEATNHSLYKVGTLIGMGKHGIFDGPWANLSRGTTKDARFEPSDTFEATITFDLDHGKATLQIGETTIEQVLPASLEQIRYLGIYAKNTRSEFTKIERVK